MTFQVADVIKPVALAGRITSTRHRIVRDDDDDADIHHKSTGKNIKLHKKRNVMSIMRMRIMPPRDEASSRDKEDARMLGELGFSLQEED